MLCFQKNKYNLYMEMITAYICLQAEGIACQSSDVPSRVAGFAEFHIIAEDFKQTLEHNLKCKNKVIKINLQRSMQQFLKHKGGLHFILSITNFLLFPNTRHGT